MNLLYILMEVALGGSALIVVLLLCRRMLRRRVRPTVLCAAWLIVALRLLLPITLPNPLLAHINPSEGNPDVQHPVAAAVFNTAVDGTLSALYVPDPPESGGLRGTAPISRSAFWPLVLRLYTIGAALTLAIMLWQNLAFRRRLRRGCIGPIDGEAASTYAALCRQRGVKPVPAYWVDGLPCACVVGALRPLLAVPITTVKDDLPAILLHEVCHLGARDPLWNLLRLAVCALHWFNPLVWVAAQASRTDVELACDARAIRDLPQAARVGYAQALMRAVVQRGPRLPVLATGMSMRGRQMTERMALLMHGFRAHRRTIAALALMLCATCVVSMAMAVPVRQLVWSDALSRGKLGWAFNANQGLPEAYSFTKSNVDGRLVVTYSAPDQPLLYRIEYGADVTDLRRVTRVTTGIADFPDNRPAFEAEADRLGYSAESCYDFARNEWMPDEVLAAQQGIERSLRAKSIAHGDLSRVAFWWNNRYAQDTDVGFLFQFDAGDGTGPLNVWYSTLQRDIAMIDWHPEDDIG